MRVVILGVLCLHISINAVIRAYPNSTGQSEEDRENLAVNQLNSLTNEQASALASVNALKSSIKAINGNNNNISSSVLNGVINSNNRVNDRISSSQFDNNADPLDDLNLARQRTRSWIGAMSNLSPAALSRLKRELESKVHTAIKRLSEATIDNEARQFKQDLLNMFLEELQETEHDMRNAIESLRRSLTSDFRNPKELTNNALARLNFLKISTLKEEQSLDKLDKIATDFENYNQHVSSGGIMDDLLKDVSKAADLLESAMKEQNQIAMNGGNIEAVIHLHDTTNDERESRRVAPQHVGEDLVGDSKNPSSSSEFGGAAGSQISDSNKDSDSKDSIMNSPYGIFSQQSEMLNSRSKISNTFDDQTNPISSSSLIDAADILVDSQNNKYVLSKPKDTTSPLVNHHFANDIMLLLLTALPLGILCHWFGLPCLFGYLMTGVLIGPSGFNQIEHVVQIETISEFGVFMIMFFTGLELNPERIMRVWKISIQGSLYTMAIIVYVGCVTGKFILKNVPMGSTAFTYACLTLSSTPLVVKFLQQNKDKEISADSECGTILLGLLVMQDVQLGFIIAILPALAKHVARGKIRMAVAAGENSMSAAAVAANTISASQEIFGILELLFEILGSLVIVVLVAIILARYVVNPLIRFLQRHPKEIQILGFLGIMFSFLLFTKSMSLSSELGCFIAGIVISTSAKNYTETIIEILEPLKDMLSTFFFTTIGFHVFPSFVAYELTILLWLTAVIVTLKFTVSALVMKGVLPSNNNSNNAQNYKWIISAGLAQISEFSFVLSSRARRLEVINREVYLLILSTTTLSLILAPVLWKLSVLHFHWNRSKAMGKIDGLRMS